MLSFPGDYDAIPLDSCDMAAGAESAANHVRMQPGFEERVVEGAGSHPSLVTVVRFDSIDAVGQEVVLRFALTYEGKRVGTQFSKDVPAAIHVTIDGGTAPVPDPLPDGKRYFTCQVALSKEPLAIRDMFLMSVQLNSRADKRMRVTFAQALTVAAVARRLTIESYSSRGASAFLSARRGRPHGPTNLLKFEEEKLGGNVVPQILHSFATLRRSKTKGIRESLWGNVANILEKNALADAPQAADSGTSFHEDRGARAMTKEAVHDAAGRIRQNLVGWSEAEVWEVVRFVDLLVDKPVSRVIVHNLIDCLKAETISGCFRALSTRDLRMPVGRQGDLATALLIVETLDHVMTAKACGRNKVEELVAHLRDRVGAVSTTATNFQASLRGASLPPTSGNSSRLLQFRETAAKLLVSDEEKKIPRKRKSAGTASSTKKKKKDQAGPRKPVESGKRVVETESESEVQSQIPASGPELPASHAEDTAKHPNPDPMPGRHHQLGFAFHPVECTCDTCATSGANVPAASGAEQQTADSGVPPAAERSNNQLVNNDGQLETAPRGSVDSGPPSPPKTECVGILPGISPPHMRSKLPPAPLLPVEAGVRSRWAVPKTSMLNWGAPGSCKLSSAAAKENLWGLRFGISFPRTFRSAQPATRTYLNWRGVRSGAGGLDDRMRSAAVQDMDRTSSVHRSIRMGRNVAAAVEAFSKTRTLVSRELPLCELEKVAARAEEDVLRRCFISGLPTELRDDVVRGVHILRNTSSTLVPRPVAEVRGTLSRPFFSHARSMTSSLVEFAAEAVRFMSDESLNWSALGGSHNDPSTSSTSFQHKKVCSQKLTRRVECGAFGRLLSLSVHRFGNRIWLCGDWLKFSPSCNPFTVNSAASLNEMEMMTSAHEAKVTKNIATRHAKGSFSTKLVTTIPMLELVSNEQEALLFTSTPQCMQMITDTRSGVFATSYLCAYIACLLNASNPVRVRKLSDHLVSESFYILGGASVLWTVPKSSLVQEFNDIVRQDLSSKDHVHGAVQDDHHHMSHVGDIIDVSISRWDDVTHGACLKLVSKTEGIKCCPPECFPATSDNLQEQFALHFATLRRANEPLVSESFSSAQ